MERNNQSGRDLLRTALGPGSDCLSVEELEVALAAGTADGSRASRHLGSCDYCRAELRLLQEFESAQPTAEEADAVERIAQSLRKRSAEIFPPAVAASKVSRWRSWFSMPAVPRAALALATILLVAGVVVQLRRNVPTTLHAINENGTEVLRSHTVSLVAPAGDVRQVPQEIRWQPIPGAVRYEVRLLEVDGNQMWKGDGAGDRIALPGDVRARILPFKTLLAEVTAFDSGGRNVGSSEPVRFRLLQRK